MRDRDYIPKLQIHYYSHENGEIKGLIFVPVSVSLRG